MVKAPHTHDHPAGSDAEEISGRYRITLNPPRLRTVPPNATDAEDPAASTPPAPPAESVRPAGLRLIEYEGTLYREVGGGQEERIDLNPPKRPSGTTAARGAPPPARRPRPPRR